jgi:hypothetical protein
MHGILRIMEEQFRGYGRRKSTGQIYTIQIVKITERGMANSSAKWIPKNCVIVAMYGATAAKVAS